MMLHFINRSKLFIRQKDAEELAVSKQTTCYEKLKSSLVSTLYIYL